MLDNSNANHSDWLTLFPFHTRQVQLLDGVMQFVDQGQGEPVLMVHGNPTWSFFFHPLIQSLQDRFRCIAIDHLGCGWSEKPAGRRWVLKDRIAHLVELIEALQLEQITLVAHDWGGAIGLGAVQRCRERFRRIVLLNTGAFPPPYIPWRIRACRIPLLGRWAVQRLNLFARGATRMATAQPQGLDARVAAGLLAPYDCWAHREAIYQFVADIPTRTHHPTWQTLARIESQLAELRDMPCLLVWGMRDWCFRPVCLDRFVRHWPHARVVRLKDAGHYVLLDEPEQVCREIAAFLDSTPAVPHD